MHYTTMVKANAHAERRGSNCLGLMEKGDSENQKQIAKTVAKVIRTDNDGHRKVQIAIPTVRKALDEIAAQEYEIIEHNLGRNTDDMDCEEIQEGIVSIRERLRKANERIIKLEAGNKYWRDCQPIQQLHQAALPQVSGSNIEVISATENKYWRDCQPIQQLHQAALPQDNGSNIEEISTQLHEVKDWIHDTIQDRRNFLPSFVSTFRSLVAIRDKFRLFEGEWKDFFPVKDLPIPRLQAFIELPEKYLERAKLVDGGLSTVQSWFVALTTKLRILEEIRKEIAQHSPSVDTSSSTMMSDIGTALDFEDIKEESVNETELGSRLDKLGKVVIKKKHLGTLASLNAFIRYAKEDEKDHEKTVQAT